jgi:hypothetical protein
MRSPRRARAAMRAGDGGEVRGPERGRPWRAARSAGRPGRALGASRRWPEPGPILPCGRPVAGAVPGMRTPASAFTLAGAPQPHWLEPRSGRRVARGVPAGGRHRGAGVASAGATPGAMRLGRASALRPGSAWSPRMRHNADKAGWRPHALAGARQVKFAIRNMQSGSEGIGGCMPR